MSSAEVVAFEAHKKSANMGGGYFVPNENVSCWRHLVASEVGAVESALAVCSGGEVGLLALLPYVTKRLVLVDHSINSLGVAISKFLVLQEDGARKTRQLFSSGDSERISQRLKKTSTKIPRVCANSYWIQSDSLDRYDTQAAKIAWSNLPLDEVEKIAAKLDLVRFYHGDVTDPKGPFDVAYLSNVHSHTGRDGYQHDATVYAKRLAPGGLALVAGSHKVASPLRTSTNTRYEPKFDLVRACEGDKACASASYGWVNCVLRKPKRTRKTK